MMGVAAGQWLLPVEGNGELERAIQMLPKKVRQLDEEIGGETDHPLDTEQEMTSRAPAPAPAKIKEDVRHHYIIRGPYDKETNTFFNGHIKTADEHAIK